MIFAESLEKTTKMHKKALKKTLFTTLKNLLKSVFFWFNLYTTSSKRSLQRLNQLKRVKRGLLPRLLLTD